MKEKKLLNKICCKKYIEERIEKVTNSLTWDNFKKYTIGQLLFFPLILIFLLVPVVMEKSWISICYFLLKSKEIPQLSKYLSNKEINEIQSIIFMIFVLCLVLYCGIASIFLTNITLKISNWKKIIIVGIFVYVIAFLGNKTLPSFMITLINKYNLSMRTTLYILNFIIIGLVLFFLTSNRTKVEIISAVILFICFVICLFINLYKGYGIIYIMLPCIIFIIVNNFNLFSINIAVIALILQNSFSITTTSVDFTLAMIFAFILTEISVHQLYQFKEKEKEELFKKTEDYIKKLLFGGGVGGAAIIIIWSMFRFIVGIK